MENKQCPIDYLQYEHVRKLLMVAPVYRKKETTALRLPLESEIGDELMTFKADSTSPLGYSQEFKSTITGDVVIARNSRTVLGQINGKPLYNKWLIARDIVEKNYGNDVLSDLGFEFTERQKKSSVRAIEITEELLEIFGIEKDQPLEIKVPWDSQPMTAHQGDFLTDQGYSISAQNMKDYAQVRDPKNQYL